MMNNLITTFMKHKAITILLCLCFISSSGFTSNFAPSTYGSMVNVRVVNPFASPAEVYLFRGYGVYGNPIWEPLGMAPAGGYIDFPNMPFGTVLGANNRAANVFWPPYTISGPNVDISGIPVHLYTLNPPQKNTQRW